MTGAMYAAVSGLKTHMNKLNVIGNNIANVNTYGYKSARTTFQESLYTSVRSGSNGTSSTGGVNPAQLGYGCNIGTIDLDMSTKNYVPTGVNLDCMISGDGFFLAGGKPNANTATDGTTLDITNAKDLNLTRVGNFTFDSQGYLVDGYGSVIYGFVTCAGTVDTTTGEETQSPTPGATDNNKPLLSTQLVPIRLPISGAAKGKPEDADYVAPGYAVYPGINGDGKNVYPASGNTISANLDSISIDGKSGKITAVNNADGKTITVGYIPLAKVANPSGVTHIQGPYYRAGEGAGDCNPAFILNAIKDKTLNNGKEPGGEALTPIFGTGETQVVTNGLESSGTDIASEFSEMISTQRGYQANTRIITVTDSMLEELVNIKR